MEKKTYFIIAIVCIVVAILYLVLPIDFVPDFITGIGWLDDVIFGAIGFVGGLVNFFIGLNTGIHLAKAEAEPEYYEDYKDFDHIYGSYREI